jgi:hypothetical protein
MNVKVNKIKMVILCRNIEYPIIQLITFKGLLDRKRQNIPHECISKPKQSKGPITTSTPR